ncbi:MAG TPA: LuxR C-terminal-related transcriptional regulator [Marmoricola sp.]|jgi:non-specific serine/threonine protein kinase|nr:LuxR C-terminal-related transcriptional regulator [Marmoricola sp.]
MAQALGGHSGLIGRVTEVAEVGGLLAPGRVVTLTGVGGVGKTRIARRVVAESAAKHPGGAWVVELADLADPGLLGEVVVGALDIQVPPGRSHGRALSGFLAERPGLLVLDNCEHLVDAVASTVAELLSECPKLTVLATSRLPLGIVRETVFSVPALTGPPHGEVVSLAESARYDAIALYTRRAGEIMASFRLTAENLPAVAELVTRLDGVPLAIELAAARVRLLSPEALLARLGERFEVLESDLRDVPVRHRSLAASVGWSYDLCSPKERELWNRLSVFVGGFELEAAEEVCADAQIGSSEVLALLSSLVDMSVTLRVGETGTRFRMLEPIRQYGAAMLDQVGDGDLWRGRHLAWYADQVAGLEEDWVGPDQLAWMDRLRAEHANLRAALEHALSSPGNAAVALRMCGGLEPLWICGGHLSEARHWIERAVASTEGHEAAKVKALRLCAWFGALQLELGYARDRVDQAALLLDGADDLTTGYHLFADGVVATWEQEFARGVELLTRSAEAFDRAGHLPGTLEAQLNTAIAHVFGADYARADEVCRACLQITDPLGETYISAYARWAVGLGSLMDGDLASAAALTTEAVSRSNSLGDRLAMALELESLAWIAAIQYDFDRGIRLLGCAELFWRMMSMPVDQTPGVSDFRALGERQVRAAIGDAAFDTSFAAGLAMAPEDVLDFVLGESGPVRERRTAGPLSRRETEVAALVAEGLSNRDIAERLFLSERTAQGHVQSILRKLLFSSRAQIAVWFVEQRLAT